MRASHNPYLASIYESVHETLINYEYRNWIGSGTVPGWLRPGEAAGLTALHAPILAAVRDRDEAAGRIAVLRHHDVMAQHLAPAGPDPGQAAQQPSYGAQLDWPPAAMALANTWFCSATLAWPKSAGLPPYAAQVEALN